MQHKTELAVSTTTPDQKDGEGLNDRLHPEDRAIHADTTSRRSPWVPRSHRSSASVEHEKFAREIRHGGVGALAASHRLLLLLLHGWEVLASALNESKGLLSFER